MVGELIFFTLRHQFLLELFQRLYNFILMVKIYFPLVFSNWMSAKNFFLENRVPSKLGVPLAILKRNGTFPIFWGSSLFGVNLGIFFPGALIRGNSL